MAATKLRCLVGSTGMRGACDACGMVAELHWAQEAGIRRLAAVCLPCAQRNLPRPCTAIILARAA